MNILVIGGTGFLGRAITESLASRGHHLTLFNRGISGPSLFSEVEHITGDRGRDLHLLKNRSWDAVVDTCGMSPSNVDATAAVLSGCMAHYLFISSCSVYDVADKTLPKDESAPIVDLNIAAEDTSPSTYGARKYLCERAVARWFPDRATIIRPGLIVGPFDRTYRFAYWIDRISEGGRVLAPGRHDAPLQFVDARDLAEWITILVERSLFGIFNAVGPSEPLTLGRFLELVVSTINTTAKLEWVPEVFLREKRVTCWSELPLWVFENMDSFLQRDSAKAIRYGLKFRPIPETIKDTLAWGKSGLGSDFKRSALSRTREQELLAAWDAVHGPSNPMSNITI